MSRQRSLSGNDLELGEEARLLVLYGANLIGSDQDEDSLVADGLEVEGDALLKSLTTAGAVRLHGARITGPTANWPPRSRVDDT